MRARALVCVYVCVRVRVFVRALVGVLNSFKACLQNRQYNFSFKYFNQSNCRDPPDVIETVATGKNKNADIICKHANK